jgi:hypothetical protein
VNDRPCIKGRAFLARPIVALVDSRDAAAAATDMVEHRFGDFQPRALGAASLWRPCGVNRARTPWASGAGLVPAAAAASVRAETIALSSARFALDQPAKGVPTAPGSASAAPARRTAQ